MGTVITEWVTKMADGISGPARELTEASRSASEAVDGIGNSAGRAKREIDKLSAMDLKAAADSVRDLTTQFQEIMRPGMAFESQMKEMQAITRLSDEAMEELGGSARRTAKAFGNDAAAQLGSYSSLIARFGPAVAADAQAMESMGHSIAVLSKSMGGDAVGAMDALTTAMLQFGVDLDNPRVAAATMAQMMNVMVAAGNEGASEVADTSEALKNAGVAALNANVSFVETNAALQALAQGGRVGAEAGVSLRNVLGKMGGLDIIPRAAREKLQALGVDYDIVSDKNRSFVERLRELSKAQGDATLIAQIFGIENQAAAGILLRSIDMQEQMVTAISGTSAAYESAGIVMDSGVERISRFDAWLNDLKISFYDVAGSLTPFVTGLGTAAFTIANVASAASGIKTLMSSIKSLTIVQWLFNASLWASPITWIVGGIAALTAGVVLAWNKFEGFRKVVMGVWEVLKGFGKIIKDFVIDRIMGVINGIGSIAKAIGALFKGDFSQAWEYAKEGVVGISGVGAFSNAIQGVKGLGNAYREGARKGEESWSRSQEEKEAKTVGPLASFQMGGLSGVPVQPAGSDGAGGTIVTGDGMAAGSVGLAAGGPKGGGSGGGKTINMTVNNYINGFKGSRELADEVARMINDRLSDGLAMV